MDPMCIPKEPAYIIYRRQKEWIERNSKPKDRPEAPIIDRGPPFSNEGRLTEISKPQYVYIKPCNDPTRWEYIMKHFVKDSAKNYVASPRIVEMAVPLHITQKYKEKKIPLSALTWVASNRLVELSNPRIPYKKVTPKPLVAPGALEYTASERIVELAKKEPLVIEQKEFVFTINPIALAYFPSKRTRIMAKPRPVFTAEKMQQHEEERLERKEISDEKRAAKEERRKKAVAKRHKQERRSMGI